MTGLETPAAPSAALLDRLARRLDAAWQSGVPVEPLSASDGLAPEHAYLVQDAWTRLRLANGDGIAGRKIGLTSVAMQAQAHVDEPDYGTMWSSREFTAVRSQVQLPTETFIQPRVEGEIAFLLARELTGGSVTAQQVLAATDAVAPAIEVIDSRIKDWRVLLADTIADNASYGGFVVGPWVRATRFADLGVLGMVLHRNGEVIQTGVGAAALGHPALAVAWLANKLHGFGISLDAGSIVLSGSVAAATDARPGDLFTLRFANHPSLTAHFS